MTVGAGPRSLQGGAGATGDAARVRAPRHGAFAAVSRASRVSMGACVLSVAALASAVAFILHPALERAEARTVECGRLFARAAELERVTDERDHAQAALDAERDAASRVLRTIPAERDQATLMRLLAVAAGDGVGTQTVVAGDPVPATPDGAPGLEAMPVTVEMRATYARIMELLDRAESSRRLVRPIRVEIMRPARPRDGDDPSQVDARIEVDAVYGSPAATGGKEEVKR
jgi:hypothetical protein